MEIKIQKLKNFIQAPTLLRGGFVLIGVFIELLLVWFATTRLYKPLDDLYFVLFGSVIYWLIILFSKRLSNTLLYLTLLLFPFNRFLILRSDQAYLLGRVSDYLLITLHLFEIPLYTLLFWTIFSKADYVKDTVKNFRINTTLGNPYKVLTLAREKFKYLLKQRLKSFFLLTSILFAGTIFVSIYLNKTSVFLLIPFLQLIFIFILISVHLNKITVKSIIRIFYISAFIQSIISIFQIVLNHSVGLYFIGESKFNSSLFYIAKTMFGNVLRVRAYGTFPHPNILGGFIFLSICLFGFDLFKEIFKKSPFVLNLRFALKSVILSLSLLTLYLTQSRTAILALILAILILILMSLLSVFNKKRAISIFLPIILITSLLGGWIFRDRILSLLSYDQSSVSNRIELADISLESVRNDSTAMLFGNGPDGFLKYLSEHKPVKTYYSFIIEPVHNVFLLFLSNFGVFGLICMLVFSSLLIIKSRFWKFALPYSIILIPTLIFLLFSFNLDHYIVTLKQGVVLLGIFSFFIVQDIKNSKIKS